MGLDGPSPDVLSPRRYGQEHGATMLFGIPGQSTSTEVSYAEWQAAYKARAQQHDTSTTQTAPSASNSAHDSTQVSVPMVGGVMVAWDSCGSENRAEEVEGRALEGEVDVAGQEERESCSTADTGRMESKHRDIIRNEWYSVQCLVLKSLCVCTKCVSPFQPGSNLEGLRNNGYVVMYVSKGFTAR